MTSFNEVVGRNISNLSDKDLVKMITVNPGDFTPEAIDFANAEIQRRGIADVNYDTYRRLEEEEVLLIEAEEYPQPNGISGWLSVPAFALIIFPIKQSIYLYFSINSVNILTRLGYHIDLASLILLAIQITMVVATIFVAFLFFQKKKKAVQAIIILILSAITVGFIEASINTALFEKVDFESIETLVHNSVFGAIWIPYFLRSKRVKNTFVY